MNFNVPWTVKPIPTCCSLCLDCFLPSLSTWLPYSHPLNLSSNITTWVLSLLTTSSSPCLAQFIMIYFIHLFIFLECKLLMRTLTVLFKWYPDIIRLNKYLLNQHQGAAQREILQGGVPRAPPSGGLRYSMAISRCPLPDVTPWNFSMDCLAGEGGWLNSPLSYWERKARHRG